MPGGDFTQDMRRNVSRGNVGIGSRGDAGGTVEERRNDLVDEAGCSNEDDGKTTNDVVHYGA